MPSSGLFVGRCCTERYRRIRLRGGVVRPSSVRLVPGHRRQAAACGATACATGNGARPSAVAALTRRRRQGYGALMQRRKLPAGIQTLRKIREDDCYYVDKTAYVHQLVTECSHCFLSRPRRFGKSLLVDTIKELFEGNEPLFRGLDTVFAEELKGLRRETIRHWYNGYNWRGSEEEKVYNPYGMLLFLQIGSSGRTGSRPARQRSCRRAARTPRRSGRVERPDRRRRGLGSLRHPPCQEPRRCCSSPAT